MIKVQILIPCEHCEGNAYVPVDEALRTIGEAYIRHIPSVTTKTLDGYRICAFFGSYHLVSPAVCPIQAVVPGSVIKAAPASVSGLHLLVPI
jgi:hypothetical protein